MPVNFTGSFKIKRRFEMMIEALMTRNWVSQLEYVWLGVLSELKSSFELLISLLQSKTLFSLIKMCLFDLS